jgi:O-antigen/teichoic acid export membrane protein
MALPVLSPLSLRVNFSWTLVGNVVYAACQWGMLVVLAKLGAPEMLGQFALGLAISTPVIMLANLQLRAIQATDARREYQFGDYLALRLVLVGLALLAIAGIAAGSGYQQQTFLVILAVGGARAIESLSDICYGLLQQHERLDRVARSMMLRGGLALGALTVGMLLTGSVLVGTLGVALAWAVVLVGYDLRSSRAVAESQPTPSAPAAGMRPRWHVPTLLRLARLAAPLGVAMMLLAVNASIPRYLVGHMLGEQALGIFAAVAYIERAGTTVVSALGQSASPHLARAYANANSAAFRVLLGKLVLVGCGVGVGGVLVAVTIGEPLLALLYQPQYARADVFAWVMVAAGLWYIASFLGYAATASRIIAWQPVVLGGSASMVLAASLLLIPHYDLTGAALAMVAASATAVLGYSAMLLRHRQPR